MSPARQTLRGGISRESSLWIRESGSISKSSDGGPSRQKRPLPRQQLLKAAAGAAGTEVVAAQLLEELFVPMDHPVAAPDARLGRIALFPLTRWLESTGGR